MEKNINKNIERNYALYLFVLLLSLMTFSECSGQRAKLAVKGEWVQIALAECIDYVHKDSTYLKESDCVIYEGNYSETGFAILEIGEEYVLATPDSRQRFLADRKEMFIEIK
jgi:hypothetical protein